MDIPADPHLSPEVYSVMSVEPAEPRNVEVAAATLSVGANSTETVVASDAVVVSYDAQLADGGEPIQNYIVQ